MLTCPDKPTDLFFNIRLRSNKMRSVRCVCHLRPRERIPVRLSQSRLLFDWDIKGLHHERLKGRSFKGTESHPGFWPFVTSLKPRPAWQRKVLTHTRQHTDTIPVVEKIIDPSRKCTHLQRLCQAANHHSPSPPPLISSNVNLTQEAAPQPFNFGLDFPLCQEEKKEKHRQK